MIEFGERQRKTIAAGITCLAAAITVATAAAFLWGVAKVFHAASAALVPLLAGIFLSFLFKPYYGWWLRRLRNPALAAVVMSVTVLVPLAVFCWCFGAFVADQIAALTETAPVVWHKLVTWFSATFPKAKTILAQNGVDLMSIPKRYGATWLSAGLGGLKYVTGLLTWLVSLIFFFFFLTRPDVRGTDIVGEMPFLKDATKAFVATEIDTFFDIMASFFRRQVIINLVEGVLYGVGFMLVGLPYGFVIGFLLGFLNLIPFFGTVVCLPVALPIAYFGDGGSLARLLAVTGVWIAGQLLDGYLITPKIQGDSTGLGYAGVIFSFLFWGAVFHSLLGLLLAIPLSAFCLVLWRALKENYIRGVI